MSKSRFASLAIAIATAVVFAALIAQKGVPILRHDWAWNGDAATFFPSVWSTFGGWNSSGIGAVRAYPDDYLIAIVNALLVWLVGMRVAFAIGMATIGYVCARAGIALAARLGGDSLVSAVASAAFVAFNPWVYNKIVAGHVFMVLAYAFAILIVAELLKSKPSLNALTAYLLLTMQQLQFFIPALLVVAVWSWGRRERLMPAAIGFAASLPIWVGIIFDRQSLFAIAYRTPWQESASLPPFSALLLSGYFTRYADRLPVFVGVATAVVALLALVGVVVLLKKRPLMGFLAVGGFLAVWTLVSGTKGVFGTDYLWLVEHVPESGLYRELYDVVGFMAIFYCAFAAFASRLLYVRWVWLAAGLLFIGGWAFVPPSVWWDSASDLPSLTLDAPENSRFALYPATQPLSRGDQGSGLDPQAVAHARNVTPLNTSLLSFPESSSLAEYAMTGDPRWLESLSVSRVVSRSYLNERFDALAPQVALPLAEQRAVASSAFAAFRPELSVERVPGLAWLPEDPWRSSVFFGDARDVRGTSVPPAWSNAPVVRVVEPNSDAVSARDGWVDVRGAFDSRPDLAQGLGGALTTNPTSVLTLGGGPHTLVYVDGTLEDALGRPLVRTTHGYRWVEVNEQRVRCNGLCAVVAQTDVMPPIPVEPAPVTSSSCAATALQWSQPAPWLAFARVAVTEPCLLRYNVRYDPHWLAFSGGTFLAHARIDATFNGYILPPTDGESRVIIIHWVSAVQVFLQMAVMIALAVLALVWIARAIRPRVAA